MKTGYMNELKSCKKEELVNRLFNLAVSSLSDIDSMEICGGKSIPYIGWYWRNTDFVGKKIRIGKCEGEDREKGFVGVMENNKWDYPERLMTEPEVDKFIEFIELALSERNKGGSVADTEKACEAVLRDMWNWFQTLEVHHDRP